MSAPDFAEKFWAQTIGEPNTGCLLWMGTTGPYGYGTIHIKRDVILKAHRVAFALSRGREAIGLVRHLCHNPACVEPRHLAEGTHKDNTRDSMRAGRLRPGRDRPPHGAAIREARTRANLSQGELAEKCGVTKITVLRLENGQHIPKVSTLLSVANALGLPLERVWPST